MERRKKYYGFLRRVRIRPSGGHLYDGARVEARPMNADELFYGATVISRTRTTDFKTGKTQETFTVRYDDGDTEAGLFAGSLIRFNRRLVWQGRDTLVEDGTILVQGREVRRARLLQFTESIGIYQSGILLSSTVPDKTDMSLLPFEVNQAMALGVALHAHISNGAPIRKACFVGLGGGAVPSFFHHLSPDSEIYAIESNEEVAFVARSFFNLSGSITIVIEDAFSWLTSTEIQFDLIVVDVADPCERFLPPKKFVDSQLIRRLARAPNAVCVMNTLNSADAPNHCWNMARVFDESFPGTSYCVSIEPNCVFFGFNLLSGGEAEISAQQLLDAARTVPGLCAGMPAIVHQLRSTTRTIGSWRNVRVLRATKHLPDSNSAFDT